MAGWYESLECLCARPACVHVQPTWSLPIDRAGLPGAAPLAGGCKGAFGMCRCMLFGVPGLSGVVVGVFDGPACAHVPRVSVAAMAEDGYIRASVRACAAETTVLP